MTRMAMGRGGFFGVPAEEAACCTLDDISSGVTFSYGPMRHMVRTWMIESVMTYMPRKSFFKSQFKTNSDNYIKSHENN
jgi:hypothetical protein